MKLESRRGEVKESFDALKVALMAQEKELMDHLDSESKAFDLNKKLVSLKFLAECISKAEPSSEISERDGELAATRFDQVHFIPRTIPISQTLGRFYRIRHCKSHPHVPQELWSHRGFSVMHRAWLCPQLLASRDRPVIRDSQ